MTKMLDYDIVGSYNNQRSTTIDAERSVNLFQYNDPLGKKQKSLINTSGLDNTHLVFFGMTGGFRAEFVFKGDHYVVVQTSVYKITSAGAVSLLGTLINTFTGVVRIDANTFQVIFVDGVNGYIYDTETSLFTQITDPAFPVLPIDVCYLDGFFVVADGNTNNFQLSTFNQGLIWGAFPDTTFTDPGFPTTNLLLSGAVVPYLQIGTPVELSTTTTLPAPLQPLTTYYVVGHPGGNNIEISATKGGTAITMTDAGTGTHSITNNGQLQQGSITSHPGNIVACRTLHRRLFLFSTNYTEVWENAGIGTNLPFRRNNSLLIEYGTAAMGSISVSFDTMVFLSQSVDGLGPVMQVEGTSAIPISTKALDFQLSQYARLVQITDCVGFLLKENGLIFYRMNFTLANHTFVYNVSLSNPQSDATKLWHEEELLNGDRHPAQTHAYFNGVNYVGHYAEPILYVLNSGTYTNDGEVIRRMRITKAVVPPGYQRLRIDRLHMDLLQGNIAQLDAQFDPLSLLTESGDELLTESGESILLQQGIMVHNPQELYVFMSISKDGGQSYGYKVKSPMGKIGQRRFRTVWRKLGVIPRGQAFVAKFEFFDAVPFIVLGGAWAPDILPE